jgi:histidine triad (HIT) family protein
MYTDRQTTDQQEVKTMAYDTDNIFAKILRGEAGCIKVFEDDSTLAFMDVMPQADGHTLVIPKEPAVTLVDLSEEGAMACARTVKRIVAAARIGLDTDGIIVMQLNGAEAGQSVPHIHFHVIPGSIHTLRPHAGGMEDPEKLKVFAEKIKSCIK